MITEEIKKVIGEALKALGVDNSEVSLEHPKDLAHGDYSTNVALQYAKELKMKPKELAEKILKGLSLKSKDSPWIGSPWMGTWMGKAEVAGAGFINFYLSKEFFAEQVKEILEKKDDFGRNEHCAGMRALVEYTQPNPFKEFHIGHLMSNAIGEAIARITAFHGAEVKRACYQGDVGLHVAKAVYGYQKLGGKTITDWGKAYAYGSEMYESYEDIKKEINELNTKIFEQSDNTVNKIYQDGKKVSLEHFEGIYKTLGTKFDYYFFESETGVLGKKLVEENLGRIFEKSEGAVVFPESKSGLHTRVFLNSQGLPTYEAKELGLAKIKYEKYPYDFSVVITGNEINEYFKVLLKAMEFVFPDLAKKTKHLSHGMLRLPTGKMSSRKGGVITGEWLIERVKKMVLEKVKEREFSDIEKEKVAEVVAVGSIKYSILRQQVGGDIVFDFDKSISFEGDSGPYLQYSYARACSVLRKGTSSVPTLCRDTSLKGGTVKAPPLKGGGGDVLPRFLYRFPEIVERAGKEYAPHYIATYLIEIAGAFNGWYAKERILDAGDETAYRLALTRAFAQVMKNGLWLLGIATPEKM
ncbi:MAG: arginyl-tRNA synthetase [Parcubacteria group bacterium Gr01-1014_17]|nr:MAG: arginyl-tRNA synthetase [Parcubacteria group bacterium Gr01-1014_17]